MSACANARWPLLFALFAGCAGVVEGEDEGDLAHPSIPDDAEIPEGADVPLLPPNEGEEDDASITKPEDTGAVTGDDVETTLPDDAGSAAVDAGVSVFDVVAPQDVVTPDPTLPPPPCRRTVGAFTWACDGPVAGPQCVALRESADPHWANNYVCTSSELGLRWSNSGPIAGMRCTQINEPAEPASHGWSDNYLCVPSESSYRLSWSYSGPIPGRECVPFYEPLDPHTWSDNYLCFTISAPPPPPPPRCTGSASGQSSIWTCTSNRNARQRCVNGNVETNTCAHGCVPRPSGADDTCAPAPPRCTGSASGQSAIWTCTSNRNARQRCVNGRVETVSCAHGCVPQPSGTNDYCAPAPPPAGSLPRCAHRPLLRWGLHPDASDRLRCAGVPAERITQTIGYAAASAGTHGPDGRVNGVQYGAATDISTRGLSTTQIHTLLSRLADQGFAGWYRLPGRDGWPSSESPHIHTIYVGCRMKSSLQAQVRDWLVGRNGLTSHWNYSFHSWSAAQRALVRSVYNRFN